MNRNKRYILTKEKLLERNRELEMENSRLKYQMDVIKNILSVPSERQQEDYPRKRTEEIPVERPSKPKPTVPTPNFFRCGRCESREQETVNTVIDDYYGLTCGACSTALRKEAERKYEEERQKINENSNNIPTPPPPPPVSQPAPKTSSTREQFDKEVKDTIREGVKPSDVAKKKKYVPPTGYNLDGNQSTQQSEQQETQNTSTEQLEVRENSQGEVVCWCGAVATQVKKMNDGKPMAFCAEHKEEADMEDKVKPVDLKKQVAEASAKKYKVRTQQIAEQIDCDNCSKKNLEGYWNNQKTNNKNYCHDCYKQIFPDIADPKCDACGAKNDTVGWFDTLAKMYCETCAKQIMAKANKK